MSKTLQDLAREGEELRARLAEFNHQRQPRPAPGPLAPGFTPADSELSRKTSQRLYAESILRKPASSLTSEEVEFLRAHVHSALREMGA